MRWKWTSMLSMFIVVAIVLVGCGDKTEDVPETTIKSDSKEIIITAKNFEFDTKEIYIKKGDKIKLTLKSDEGIHGLSIKDLDIDVKGNSSIEFVAEKTGTFEYVCSVSCGKGHTDMKGKLIIE